VTNNAPNDRASGRVDESPSLMSITGRNAAYSLTLGLGAAFVLALAYTLMSLILDAMNTHTADVGTILRRTWLLFKTTSVCAAPIVFIISFALLQRLKIKY
jgi:hypothetical protein